MKIKSLLFISYFLFIYTLFGQEIPSGVAPVCSNQNIESPPPEQNLDWDNVVRTSIACFGQALDNRISFYLVQIKSGTTFTFELTPEDNVDYDFASWKNPDLTNFPYNLGYADRSSLNTVVGNSNYSIGLSLNASEYCEGPGAIADGLVKYYDVVPGDQILIAVNSWEDQNNPNNSPFIITFGGDSELDCSIAGDNYDVCDVDDDGEEDFNLDDIALDLVDDGEIITFYDDYDAAINDANTNIVTSPYTVYTVNNPTELYAQVKNSNGAIVKIITIFLNVYESPTATNQTISLCDVDNDSTENFDLTEVAPNITGTQVGITLSYYENLADAEAGNNNTIANETNYASGNNTVYVRVLNESGCFIVVTINLELIPFDINVDDLVTEDRCDIDDNSSETYNLEVLLANHYDNPNNYLITYHTSQTDAEDGLNPITTPSNYNAPIGTTVIWVRYKAIDSDCDKVISITLNVLSKPIINTPAPYEVCDEDFTGDFNFDLTSIDDDIIADPANYTIGYYTTLLDANQSQNPIPQNQWNNYTINTLPSSIWVRVENTGGCFAVQEIEFIAGQSISVNPTPYPTLTVCDNETFNNIIDLTQNESQITNETGVSFNYYLTQNDAEQEINEIANPSNYETSLTQQQIFVRLTKEGLCPSIVAIDYEVLPVFNLDIPTTLVLCEEGDSIDFSSDPNNEYPNATFLWEWENGTHLGSDITINELGSYTLTVTTTNGCQKTYNLDVLPTGDPTIVNITVGQDYLVIEAIAGKGGLLEYSIDGITWQISNRFDNLEKGKTYTVRVRESGCSEVMYDVAILMIPNFVSPNNDGYNDLWDIKGIQSTTNATLKIFDRYGKLFVDTKFEGGFIWDGKYLGRPIPSGDYWYIINIPESDIIDSRKYVGNISVRN